MGRKLTTTDKARRDTVMVLAYGRWTYNSNGQLVATVPCSWCGSTLDVLEHAISDNSYERDRIEPGGEYSYTNVIPSCRGCNRDRGNNTSGEWSESNRLYSTSDAKYPLAFETDADLLSKLAGSDNNTIRDLMLELQGTQRLRAKQRQIERQQRRRNNNNNNVIPLREVQ